MMQITDNILNDNMISTGFETLDSILGGWHNGDLIVIASRSGMGKTNFVCSIFDKLSIIKKIKCAYFSLEMNETRLLKRFMIPYSGFDESEIAPFINAPLWIDDTPWLSISEFKDKVVCLVKNKEVKLIAVDYFQLLTVNGNLCSKDEKIKYLCDELKSIAEELNVPIIVCSQLIRTVDRRADQRPSIVDFGLNSHLADAADVVILLYRASICTPLLYNSHADDNAEIIIAKNVHGSIGTKSLAFTPYLCRFHEIEESVKIKAGL